MTVAGGAGWFTVARAAAAGRSLLKLKPQMADRVVDRGRNKPREVRQVTGAFALAALFLFEFVLFCEEN
jgi:hypothetical protein